MNKIVSGYVPNAGASRAKPTDKPGGEGDASQFKRALQIGKGSQQAAGKSGTQNATEVKQEAGKSVGRFRLAVPAQDSDAKNQKDQAPETASQRKAVVYETTKVMSMSDFANAYPGLSSGFDGLVARSGEKRMPTIAVVATSAGGASVDQVQRVGNTVFISIPAESGGTLNDADSGLGQAVMSSLADCLNLKH